MKSEPSGSATVCLFRLIENQKPANPADILILDIEANGLTETVDVLKLLTCDAVGQVLFPLIHYAILNAQNRNKSRKEPRAKAGQSRIPSFEGCEGTLGANGSGSLSRLHLLLEERRSRAAVEIRGEGASCRMPRRKHLGWRHRFGAVADRERAPRPEPATRRRVCRAGHLPDHQRPLTVLFDPRIQLGRRCQQHLRIGVARMIVKFPRRAMLDDLAEIHDVDAEPGTIA